MAHHSILINVKTSNINMQDGKSKASVRINISVTCIINNSEQKNSNLACDANGNLFCANDSVLIRNSET
jgi:hypothetical protein